VVKRAMTKAGIPWKPVDLTTDADAHAFVTGELGYMSAPVTVVFDEIGHVMDHWDGFRPDRIDEYGLKF
jgi:glutaredoxin-like protein NrdH